jgi:hypothetical protein
MKTFFAVSLFRSLSQAHRLESEIFLTAPLAAEYNPPAFASSQVPIQNDP